MRILLVEDDADKLRRVATVLTDAGCSIANIDTARNGLEAKKLVRAQGYDLMVLDIALPARADSTPDPDGGIKLLEEILARDIYKKPREVVGLTAFAEVREKAGARFAEDLWLVVQYDASSESWSQQLKRKIRHIEIAQRGGIPTFATTLCVVTALYSPEMKAVLDLPWEWRSHEQPGDGVTYSAGKYKSNDRTCSVIAASAPRMGMVSSALLAGKMIQSFRPRYIAMVGITAGVKEACSVGDIIAVDPGWDWGSGKRHMENGVSKFSISPHQIGVNSYIRGRLAALSQDEAIFEEIRKQWRGPKPDTILRMNLGPVASGAPVLANPTLLEEIREQHRKLLGVEMEAYGVLAAADEAPLPQPKAFVLKSVSDFADADKDDTFQLYAAYTSAQTLRIFVEQYL